jgi:hypothetical protein
MTSMQRLIPAVVAAVALTFVAVPGTATAQEQSIEGAWRVTHWDGPEESFAAQPGLMIFTSTHYAIMYVGGSEARGGYDGEAGMTDEERTHAYNTFTANAGRYTRDGDKLTTMAYVSKDMNYMGAFPDNQVEFTIHFAGDVLHLAYGPETFSDGWTATLERVEGKAME